MLSEVRKSSKCASKSFDFLDWNWDWLCNHAAKIFIAESRSFGHVSLQNYQENLNPSKIPPPVETPTLSLRHCDDVRMWARKHDQFAFVWRPDFRIPMIDFSTEPSWIHNLGAPDVLAHAWQPIYPLKHLILSPLYLQLQVRLSRNPVGSARPMIHRLLRRFINRVLMLQLQSKARITMWGEISII